MTIKSIWLRRIHKWVGLVIGLQFLVWAISGTAMALLDMDEVAGGEMAAPAQAGPIPASSATWPAVRGALAGERVEGLKLRPLDVRTVIEVSAGGETRLFDAADGRPVSIDAAAARRIAQAAHPGGAAAASVAPLGELGLAVREHALPIWQVDFADDRNSSYFVSGTTGEILERRNDTWRWWDFFWMLHIMDYDERENVNNTLLRVFTWGAVLMALSGAWMLLFSFPKKKKKKAPAR